MEKEDPAMEETLSSPSIHEDSDDPDYTPLSLDMDTSSNEDEQLLLKHGWRQGGGDGMEDDSEASSG